MATVKLWDGSSGAARLLVCRDGAGSGRNPVRKKKKKRNTQEMLFTAFDSGRLENRDNTMS